MGYFQELLYNMDYYMDFKYALSFALVFVVVYGLIDVTGIFSRKTPDGKEKRLWKVELILSMAVSFLVLYNPGVAEWIFMVVSEFTNWILVIFFGAVIFYMFTKLTVFGGEAHEAKVVKTIVKVAKWGGFILGVAVFLYFIKKYAPTHVYGTISQILGPIIVLLLFIGIPAYYIYHTSKNRSNITPREQQQESSIKAYKLADCIEEEMRVLMNKGIARERAAKLAQEHCEKLLHEGKY